MTTVFATHDFGCECANGRPASSYAVIDNFLRYAYFCSPVGCTQAFPFKSKNDVSAVVAVLRLSGCPLAITWLISRVIVLTLDLQSFFVTGSHVGNEVVRVKPAVTDSNASAAITFIAFVFGVCASANHAFPDLKKRVAPLAVFCYSLFMKASATLRASIAKRRNIDIADWALA